MTADISIRAARRDDLEEIDRITIDADRRFGDAGHPELADGETMPRTQRDVPFNGPFFARHGFVEIARRDWSAAQHAVAAEQASTGLHVATRAFMRRGL